jgi:peptidoglycan/xylan/chitin deacetylase (PgdA/CDA1 family)
VAPLVLCYHAVGSWPNPSTVSEELLSLQLETLRKRGFEGLTLRELVWRRRDGTLPRRAVAITFDDGYASTMRARPLLDAFGFPATVFVTTSFVDTGEPLAWAGVDHWLETPHADELAPLSWEDLAALADAGWEVGSHTVTHPFLSDVSGDELERELADSREAIRRRVGRCDTLAYPYGAADDRVAQAARACGYVAACTLSLSHRAADLHRIGRVGIYGHDQGLRFRAKVSPVSRALRRTRIADGVAGVRDLLAAA